MNELFEEYSKVDDEEEIKMEVTKKRNSANNSSLRKTSATEVSKKGKYVRVESDKFDIILNILIGIRRSLGNLVSIPGQKLSDWQYEKKLSMESDWVRNGRSAEGKKSVNSFKFDDYAPMVF